MSDRREDEENFVCLESEEVDDDTDTGILDNTGILDYSDDEAIAYGASTFDADTGVLTYRGSFISPLIKKTLITSIVFADEVEAVADGYFDEDVGDIRGVFEGLNALVVVQINSACTVIGACAFYRCSSLVSVHMSPGSCVKIHRCAFNACFSIVSMNIPGSCTYMGEYCCGSCTSLTTVHFAEAHLIEFNESLFIGCIALTTINLPSLTAIPSRSFSGCTSLITIAVPETCQEFGDEAFDGCVLLEAAALKMNITVEQLLCYRCRLHKFIIPSFLAFKRCDMLKARTGNDGIGVNEDKDMMVLMYRKIESADLWRKILGYVGPADV